MPKYCYAPRTCEICSEQYGPSYPAQRTCSRACGHDLKRFVTGTMTATPKRSHVGRLTSRHVWFPDCSECGQVFCARQAHAVVCSAECRRRRCSRVSCDSIKRRYASDPEFRAIMLDNAHRRRADKLGLGSAEVLLTYLIERDGNRCQIPDCLFKSRTIATFGNRGPRKPSIDHITPLSRGGEHDLANVQLAHYRCNLAKHNRGAGDQLALIG